MPRQTTILTQEVSGLAKRITLLREERKLSKRQLADAVGISAPTISSIEIGSRLPSLDLLVKLAIFFNVSSDYLLGIEDRSQIAPPDYITSNQRQAINNLIAEFTYSNISQ